MYTAKINAATNNIPTSFDATAGSKIITSAPSGGVLSVINTTDSIIYIVWGVYLGTSLPSSTIPGTMLAVPAAPTGGSGARIDDHAKIKIGDSVYVMTDAASARTSGLVVVSIL